MAKKKFLVMALIVLPALLAFGTGNGWAQLKVGDEAPSFSLPSSQGKLVDYYGDYYPLTPYSRDEGTWMAWQFNRPETGEGMIQVFRRAESVYVSAEMPLKGLEPDKEYVVTRVDAAGEVKMKGADLMGRGLAVDVKERPGVAIFGYKRGTK